MTHETRDWALGQVKSQMFKFRFIIREYSLVLMKSKSARFEIEVMVNVAPNHVESHVCPRALRLRTVRLYLAHSTDDWQF